MTNQAAQTMPFQPEIFRAIARSTSDTAKTNALLNAAREIERLTAALAQTAWVPPGWKLVPVEPTDAMLDKIDCYDPETLRQRYADMLALAPAAPAASGGESAASVSERARELLATEYDKIGLNGAATYIRSGEHGELDKAIIRALEQALTQPSDAQRERDLLAEAIGNAGIKCGLLRKDIEGLTGPQLLMVCDDMAEALTQQRGASSVRIEDLGIHAPIRHAERADAEKAYSITAHDFEKNPIGLRDWTIYWRGWWHRSQLYTTPQPSADAVRDGYYLASFKRSHDRGYVTWWMADNAGYTSDLNQAGIYTELTPGYHDSEYTVPVPVSFIDRLRVRRMVDVGDSDNRALWTAKDLRAALDDELEPLLSAASDHQQNAAQGGGVDRG